MKQTFPGISRRLLLCGASGAALAVHRAATAQGAWPQRPIRLVVPFAVGGGTDIVARMIGQALSQHLGRPVVIDNKPGASTLIGTGIVARARPDGYTLLLAGSTSYSVNPALRAARAYNPSRDLSPIAIVARVPLVLFAGGTTPWHSLPALIGAARALPGQIRYATFGNASGSHLTGELFALAAGIRLQDIAYRGSSQAMVAVIGGEVDLGIDTVASVAPHARSGKVRALGIVGAARSSLLPGVRTLAEQGLPEASFDAWYGFAAPAHTPASVLARLTRAISETLGSPALQVQLRAQGIEPTMVGAAAFMAQIEREIPRYRALAHRAGIAANE
ncbi:tripartite-type tricarboxylate transporter receptor subunit TctC [Variovorax boronicumulans]|uniref:Bug family tripartite tricarboxylate transporter substrate binding protein n=1 Tax=Variovorax boronicumulans TaxID=436515 RepID=UPI002473BF37|nr:tripartite tricarboxylate transporter substrate binding protein [Variovorax boronicumulans]MDH6167968.1 tripartite-type tricarboxylate transporter receptor subunit TctC [Variovorax boronicumulans]